MGDGIYTAAAGALLQERALEVAANNLANVNTTGFRAQRLSFREVQGALTANDRNRALSQAAIDGTHTDLRAGVMQETGRGLDVAVAGPGLLMVETPSGVQYTRAGSLEVAVDGSLVTLSQGARVLGQSGPIRIPEDATVSLQEDGTVFVNGEPSDKLRLVEVDRPQDLRPAGDGFWTGEAAPRDATSSSLRVGFLEGSNVSPVETMVDLVTIARVHQAFHSVIETYREIDGRTATTLGK